jgi:hypothetical protein
MHKNKHNKKKSENDLNKMKTEIKNLGLLLPGIGIHLHFLSCLLCVVLLLMCW